MKSKKLSGADAEVNADEEFRNQWSSVSMELAIVYVTVANREEALAISHELLKEKLIACANLIDGMTSVYEWKGEIQEDSEVVLLLKTSPCRILEVTERVIELHSYETPCVFAIRSEEGSRRFFEWVHECTINQDPKIA